MVLDSADDLPWEAAGAFSAWCEAAPELTLIVCGRAHLRSAVETSVRVPVLTTAAGRQLLRQADLDLPDAQLDRIVAEVDGLPYALQLAAARLRHRPVETIDGGAYGLSESVRSSCSRISPGAATLLRVATCFRGGFDVSGAAAMLPDEPGWAVQELLDELVDGSLLLLESDDEGDRYQMLRSVRDGVAPRGHDTQLRARDERAHADFVLRRVELFAAGVGGRYTRASRAGLAREAMNARVAIRRMRQAEPLVALRLRMAMIAYDRSSTPAGELAEALEALLVEDVPPAWRARANWLRAGLLREAGRLEAAMALIESTRPTGAELGLRFESELCSTLLAAHDFEGCLAVGTPALERAWRSGCYQVDGVLALVLAHAHRRQGRLEQARELANRARGVAERRGSVGVEVAVLRLLGSIETDAGRLERASRLRLEERDAAARLDEPRRCALAALSHGYLLLRREAHDAARAAFEAAIQSARAVGTRLLLGDGLNGLVLLETDLGRRAPALRHLGALRSVASATEHPLLEAYAHHRAGCLELDGERYDDAIVELDRALRIYREHGLEFGVGRLLSDRAALHHLCGESAPARVVYSAARVSFERSTDRRGRAESVVRRSLLEPPDDDRREELAAVGPMLEGEGAHRHYATWVWVAARSGVIGASEPAALDPATYDARLAGRLAAAPESSRTY